MIENKSTLLPGPSGRVGNAVTGEGKISLIFNFEKHQRKPFSKPQSLAYRRKTYPPRACHLAVTARPSQREGGDIYAYITTKLCEEPQREGGLDVSDVGKTSDKVSSDRIAKQHLPTKNDEGPPDSNRTCGSPASGLPKAFRASANAGLAVSTDHL